MLKPFGKTLDLFQLKMNVQEGLIWMLKSEENKKLIIDNKNLQVRMLVDKDKIRLVKWLSNPEVLEYYEGRDHPFDEGKVEQHFFTDEDVTRCIIEFDGTPIGYLQFYEVDEAERKIYDYDVPEEIIYGMDQFIGEPTFWNKGIGTELVRAVVTYLMREKDAKKIVMDPQIQNERAIRCYEKCGFKKVKLLPKHELHEGELRDCWLIELKRWFVIDEKNNNSSLDS